MCQGQGQVTTPGVMPRNQQKQLDALAPPDITDAFVQRARRSAALGIGVKQGLGSTFLTSPSQSTLLGGGLPGEGTSSPNGGA